MSVTGIIGRKNLGTRRPVKSSGTSTGTGQATRGSSPTLAAFRSLIERFARAGGADIHRLRDEVVSRIQRARDPGLWVNASIDECVNRGGPDGLVMAVEVLARIDPRVVSQEAGQFVRRERPRWRKARRMEYSRYTVHDEVCHVFLRAVCQTADFESAFALIRMSLWLGPDSIREGIAAAVSDLGDRWPDKRRILSHLVNGVLDGTRPMRDRKLSSSSRNAFADTLRDLGA